MADRYHRAAQDGYLEVLKEATKKDCNSRDGDGMTPTLWAAFEGNTDALRLLVGRGGDPERSDYYGNTALHLSSARGHMRCVTFLVNFGVNLWRQDIDGHSPQELAAMNDCHDILRYLDAVASKMEVEDGKRAKKMQEQAEKDSQRLAKNFKKVQAKADRQSNKKEKELEQRKKRMAAAGEGGGGGDPSADSSQQNAAAAAAATMSFSDMVGVRTGGGGGADDRRASVLAGSMPAVKTKAVMGSVFKKAGVNLLQKQAKAAAAQNAQVDTGFKITDVEDGKRTVRSLSGLKRDNEILFVAPPRADTIDEEDEDGDGSLSGGGTTGSSSGFGGMRAATAGAWHVGGGGGGMVVAGGGPSGGLDRPRGSITSTTSGGGDFPGLTGGRREMTGLFERPGFGSVAFRRGSMASALMAAAAAERNSNGNSNNSNTGSTGDGDGDSDSSSSSSLSGAGGSDYDGGESVAVFLSGLGLQKYAKVFAREKIDLETLMLLTDANLSEMAVEMGPRKKILRAIEERKRDLRAGADGGANIQDSQL